MEKIELDIYTDVTEIVAFGLTRDEDYHCTGDFRTRRDKPCVVISDITMSGMLEKSIKENVKENIYQCKKRAVFCDIKTDQDTGYQYIYLKISSFDILLD